MYSKIIEGTFTAPGDSLSKFLALPFLPNTIELWNETQWGAATANLIKYSIGFAEQAAGTANTIISTGVVDNNYQMTTGGFSFISAGSPVYGPATTSTAGTPVSKAATAVVHSVAHGLQTGDAVLITGTTAMLQISGIVYTITKTGPDDFTIPVDSSGFANAATSVTWRKVLYPDLYIPYGCAITAITKVPQAVITTAVNHKFVVGQEVFFVIPPQWGMTQLDSQNFQQSNTGVPQQAYVTAVTANTVTVNIDTSAFTTFAFPTTGVAATGVTPAQILAIGDQNTGYTLLNGKPPFLGVQNGVIGIPGSFVANTRQGVFIGGADATVKFWGNSTDTIRFRASYPDTILLNQ